MAHWCQNVWQLAPDMKCALWPVVLYFNWCILWVFKDTKLLSYVMQLLTASDHLRHTTSVLAPAQQHTNRISVARRLFPFSQNEVFLCSWGPESFIVIFRATRNASAVHEMQFFSSSSLCKLCAQFLHFLWTFVTSVFVCFRCTTQTPYQESVFVRPYVCPCRTFHFTVRSSAALFSFTARRP
jgi:hypothetical protein